MLLSLLFYSESAKAVVGTPYFHLFSGATMLGAFFIATDPSSSAITPGGRLAYGLLIALLIYTVRVWGSYLDAVAIAVLLANFLAPLLDRLFAPRLFGQASSDTGTGEPD
jgi:electron transport complex protein RnfD